MKRTSLGAVLIAVALASWVGNGITFHDQFTCAGVALGAGTGAIIGAAAGNPMAGAAIGGPIGMIAGYLIGDSLRRAQEHDVVKRGQGGSSGAADSKNAEVAHR
jgi:uncharacterized protein YcfJ